jgi:proteic killer suppression protein
MIGSIRHKGLKRLYEDGDPRGIGANLRKRVSEILSVLDAAESVEEADIPGYRLHPLSGDRQGYWSVKVTGNWRITFRFQDGYAEDVNLEDYH